MPRGSKSSYSPKQKRKAAHIEEGYRKEGVSAKEAGERAWRTVNKQDGGARGKNAPATKRKRSGPRKKTATRSRSRARKRS